MPEATDESRLWYKDAVIYEVHIKSYYDSNNDGIGDFRGLLKKLPFLKELGVTAVWILPFYPSPLRDDGYDIADYLRINPDYGTMNDFREFLRQAHARGIRVITELVLNHTSDQHAWFQRARRAKPGSPWRDFYVWSDNPDKYRDARIIFKDFEPSNWSWDPVAKAYYWHRFYAHQPDLNYDNPRVHKAVLRALDFWLDMGVDGFRLDAIPYLYEREGTNCENLPETYAFIKKLRAHVDGKYPNRLLLAEANQWPEDAVAYFGEGDLCQMAFHFPLMPRMFMAIQMEDRFPIVDILEQTPRIPDSCQWGLFLRNHDELTLEMVTDEERDYMYRVYARDPRARINLGIRRRLAPLMGNDRRKIELMNVLLFSLPGTPIIYYGDEIGMGDNYYLGDRNGVRTPMQWSPDRNAGFSLANPQKLFLPVIIDPEYHYEAVSVETQSQNPSSLLWWMRRMIDLRKRFKAFGRGSFEFVTPDNPKVLAFVRSHGDETVLVLINLSRFSQAVEIGTPRFAGFSPEDVFSRNRFPVIKESPYVILLGGYDYHLLLMKKEAEAITLKEEVMAPEISVENRWENVLKGKPLERLTETILPEYLRKCRWFGGKGRIVNTITLTDSIPISGADVTVFLLLLEIAYAEGGMEVFLLPVHYAVQGRARHLLKESPEAVIARLRVDEREGILYDGVYDGRFREALFEIVARGKRIRVGGGELSGRRARMFTRLLAGALLPAASQILRAEQSNTSILFDNSYFFKLYRRAEEGIHPEEEIGKFLTEIAPFEGVAPFVGTLEYRRPAAGTITIAMLQWYIPNHGDAWTFTLDEVTRYFDGVLSKKGEMHGVPPLPPTLLDIDLAAVPHLLQELIGGFYLEMVALLGQRTGELHRALASRTEEPDFSPEPFSTLYQRSMYQSMRSLTRKSIIQLNRNLGRLAPEVRSEAEWVLGAEPEILERQGRFLGRKLSAMKIRIHGDYHLGQVLFTGKDFVIIDFEGEPARAMSERRIKRSPLQDVAGMIRSFHYAAHAVLLQRAPVRAEDVPYLEPWAEAWHRCCAGIFLHSYLQTVAGAPFMPKEREELEVMLSAFMLDKALYELGYELENRPEWVMIPLRGIRRILENSLDE
ncbi:MAG TPA: maltose alpha-D-glucosyltransferase [Geobacteraceae bacterium]